VTKVSSSFHAHGGAVIGLS